MSKFIPMACGSYVNVEKITGFYLEHGRKTYTVKCFILSDTLDDNDREWNVMDEFQTEEKAQDWLDRFMESYGLCS